MRVGESLETMELSKECWGPQHPSAECRRDCTSCQLLPQVTTHHARASPSQHGLVAQPVADDGDGAGAVVRALIAHRDDHSVVNGGRVHLKGGVVEQVPLVALPEPQGWEIQGFRAQGRGTAAGSGTTALLPLVTFLSCPFALSACSPSTLPLPGLQTCPLSSHRKVDDPGSGTEGNWLVVKQLSQHLLAVGQGGRCLQEQR